jgi:hypothetical protein
MDADLQDSPEEILVCMIWLLTVMIWFRVGKENVTILCC